MTIILCNLSFQGNVNTFNLGMDNSNQTPSAQYWQTSTQQNQLETRQDTPYDASTSANQTNQSQNIVNRDSQNSVPAMFVPNTEAHSNLGQEQALVNSDVTGSGQNSTVPSMFVPSMGAVSGMGQEHAQINNDVRGEGQNSGSTVPNMFVPNLGANNGSDNQQGQNYNVEGNQASSSFTAQREVTGENNQNLYASEYPTQQVTPGENFLYGNGPTTAENTPGNFVYDDVAQTLDCTNLDFYEGESFDHLLGKQPSGSSIDQTETSGVSTSTSDNSFDYFSASNFRVS